MRHLHNNLSWANYEWCQSMFDCKVSELDLAAVLNNINCSSRFFCNFPQIFEQVWQILTLIYRHNNKALSSAYLLLQSIWNTATTTKARWIVGSLSAGKLEPAIKITENEKTSEKWNHPISWQSNELLMATMPNNLCAEFMCKYKVSHLNLAAALRNPIIVFCQVISRIKKNWP